MKKVVSSLLLTLYIATSIHAQRFTKPSPTSKLKNDPAHEQEFMDWGWGMFVHWSLDSQLGSVISHSMDYASRVYLDCYANELPRTFNPTQCDPDKWMKIANLAGAKYMDFTTKHHSGFCMRDTETKDFNIMNTPYGKDIVGAYVDACRRHGMKVGYCYSPEDFAFHYERDIPACGAKDSGKYHDELVADTKTQVDELFANYGEIDVIFLDGGHKGELAQHVCKIATHCLVTRGKMVTPEQKLPAEPIPGTWETCFTLGNQRQYKPTNQDYKSGTRLINMGPMSLGMVPLEQEERFRELALWMFVNDEAIHDIRACVTAGSKDVYYTQSKDGKTVNALLTGLTDEDLKGGTQWGRSVRKEVVLKDLTTTPETKNSVSGPEDRIENFTARNPYLG